MRYNCDSPSTLRVLISSSMDLCYVRNVSQGKLCVTGSEAGESDGRGVKVKIGEVTGSAVSVDRLVGGRRAPSLRC